MTGLSFPTGVWDLCEKMETLGSWGLLPAVPTHASGKPDPYKEPHCTMSKSSHKLSSTSWPSEGPQDPTTHCGLERFKGKATSLSSLQLQDSLYLLVGLLSFSINYKLLKDFIHILLPCSYYNVGLMIVTDQIFVE